MLSCSSYPPRLALWLFAGQATYIRICKIKWFCCCLHDSISSPSISQGVDEIFPLLRACLENRLEQGKEIEGKQNIDHQAEKFK